MHATKTDVRPVLEGQILREPAVGTLHSDKFALIIPTLHEAESISAVLGRIGIALEPLDIAYEIIVVDDDSRDGIVGIVTDLAKADPRIRIVTRKGERGLAGAITHGWSQTDATIIGAIDADLQHPPELLPQMLNCLWNGADLVVASRYACGGSLNRWSRYRHFLSWAAICSTMPLQKSGLRTTDPMSGFFLLRRKCLADLTLQKSGFKILLEILVRCDVRSVSEVPFVFGHRKAGRSKASLRVAFDYLKLLIRLYGFRAADMISGHEEPQKRPAYESASTD